MAQIVILVDNRDDFVWNPEGRLIIASRDYILQPPADLPRTARILNLSRSYSYLGIGYYCSLLAEARHHRIMPSASTILDLGQRGRYWSDIEALEETLRRSLKNHRPETDRLNVDIYFGRSADARFAEVAREAFDLFRCPMLRIRVRYENAKWYVDNVLPLTIRDLTPETSAVFGDALDAYTRARWRAPKARPVSRYNLAILHDPEEKLPPSDGRALERFIRVGEQLGVEVDLIEKRDYTRVAEYDALFIRETTAIDHHTFRFAKKADDEGMPVIDDPESILRCANKVYLAEILAKNGVPTPKTVVFDQRRLRRIEEFLSYPVVLKIPDGAFSRGIVKVENRAELEASAAQLFQESDLILGQEFMFTEFDWRVGVLNRRPLFVCQYRMAPNHWQIVKYGTGGRFKEGGWSTLTVEEAPQAVVALAVRAASLIGDGLYGVDIKETPQGIFVIEVNDNPNIEAGVEDARLKDGLYQAILEDFIRRIEAR